MRNVPMRVLCQSLSDGLDEVVRSAALGGDAEHQTQREKADVGERLRTAIDYLDSELASESNDSANQTGIDDMAIVRHLLATGVLQRLVVPEVLQALDFEARKSASRVFCQLMKLGCKSPSCAKDIVQNFCDNRQILERLIDGCGRQSIFCQCAEMLQASFRCPGLAVEMLEAGTANRLLTLAKGSSFDLSSEAFSCLRSLLFTGDQTIPAKFLTEHSTEFFTRYNTLLEEDNYVTQRQGLRLLADILLNRTFAMPMVAYVSNEKSLQIHMNLLRSNSKSIQLEAFHIFKVFVANPSKPKPIHTILYNNKERLVKLIASFTYLTKEADDALLSDLSTVDSVLRSLTSAARNGGG